MSDPSEVRLRQAVKYVVTGRRLRGVEKIAHLTLPKESAEFKRCQEIQAIFEEYGKRTDDPTPLSIAVFGPPGSGKSFCVKQLIASLEGKGKWGALQTANLSQMPDLQSLATFLRSASGEGRRGDSSDSSETRVLFFDEFDAPMGGESLGWLRWFLAPMQDGKFFNENHVIHLRKTILVFAGGTAPTLEEFERRALINEQDYRAKKVPDFISRLHAFIDIQGINGIGAERPIRRALVLSHLLSERWKDVRPKGGGFPISEGLCRKLLTTAHFIHGVRSMSALLDTSRLNAGRRLTEANLPETDLRRLHISRGPLDGKVVGISAGLQEGSGGLLKELTQALLGSGATLAYGGDFIPKGTLAAVVKAALEVPDDLIKRTDVRIRNYLGFPSFLNRKVLAQNRIARNVVDFRYLETLSESEKGELGVPRDGWFPARPLRETDNYDPRWHLAWAVSLFRMRVRLCQDVDALIVLGGKDGESWGRFSGIAEEVMLAIALRKPVYMLGGLGGSSRAVGNLLGLGQTLVNPDGSLDDPGPIKRTSLRAERCFTIPNVTLPLTVPELRAWLQQRCVWTEEWPWNGLTSEENRTLFLTPIPSSDQSVCVRTIIDGLCRLDWKPGRG